jgi:hypothetical protein
MTRWDEIKAKRAERDPGVYDRIEHERRMLEQIKERRQDKAFMARIRAAIERERGDFDRLRDR